MGITAQFEQITREQLSSFVRDPRSAYAYVLEPFFDDPEARTFVENALQKMRETQSSAALSPKVKERAEGLFGQMLAKMDAQQGPQLVNRESAAASRIRFSLEKDWHVMHYALNGSQGGGDGPLANAILGGTDIPDVDGVNAGLSSPMRYLTPEQVQGIAAALAAVNPAQLMEKLDYEDALSKKIYLAHTLDDLESWSYLPSLFEQFREFYIDAAQNDRALLIRII